MIEERLTDNFFLSEFTQSQTAVRLGIPNEPDQRQLANLRLNADGMEEVRGLLGVPILISSGLRTEALERVISERDYLSWCRRHTLQPGPSAWERYFSRKQHPKGLATDFTAPAYGPPLEVCRRIVQSDIKFDQVIHEHTWVHISWPEAGKAARREALTLIAEGYAKGIV